LVTRGIEHSDYNVIEDIKVRNNSSGYFSARAGQYKMNKPSSKYFIPSLSLVQAE